MPYKFQFAHFSSFFFCFLPCTKCRGRWKKKKESTLQCSSPVLDSLEFAAFCSTSTFLSATALWALVLHTCLPRCSFIARSGEAGSAVKGISKIALCSPVASPGSCAQGCYTWSCSRMAGLSAGRSLTSRGTGLATRESGKSKGNRQFWVRFLCISDHISPLPPFLHMHTILQSLIFPRFLFRSVSYAAALHGFCH